MNCCDTAGGLAKLLIVAAFLKGCDAQEIQAERPRRVAEAMQPCVVLRVHSAEEPRCVTMDMPCGDVLQLLCAAALQRCHDGWCEWVSGITISGEEQVIQVSIADAHQVAKDAVPSCKPSRPCV